MTDKRYDLVERVEIGWAAGANTAIVNIVGFGDRFMSRDGKLTDPINMINYSVPRGVHHNWRNYEMVLVLDSDNYEALYAQQVTVGVAASYAILQGAANSRIDYFVVYIREEDGTQTTYTYQTERVWCVGAVHEYSNERNLRHQGTTTYRFVCLGTRVRAGW